MAPLPQPCARWHTAAEASLRPIPPDALTFIGEHTEIQSCNPLCPSRHPQIQYLV